MKSLTTLLQESYETYQIDVLLKNYKRINKSEIVNKIRAVPYVIRVRMVDDPRLHNISKQHDYELSILRVKYLNVFNAPSKGALIIRDIVENGKEGFHKIEGVINFKPLLQTLHSTVNE